MTEGLAMNDKGTTHPPAEDLAAGSTTRGSVRVLDVEYVHVYELTRPG